MKNEITAQRSRPFVQKDNGLEYYSALMQARILKHWITIPQRYRASVQKYDKLQRYAVHQRVCPQQNICQFS